MTEDRGQKVLIWDLGLWIADWSDFRRVTRNAKPVTEPTAATRNK
jgi:hypothetical protein